MNEPYKNKDLMFELYVTRRMPMTKIRKHMEDTYGCNVTEQTIYNWLRPERHDLLKYRGKGKRKLNRQKQLSPAAKEALARRREQKKIMKQRAGRK